MPRKVPDIPLGDIPFCWLHDASARCTTIRYVHSLSRFFCMSFLACVITFSTSFLSFLFATGSKTLAAAAASSKPVISSWTRCVLSSNNCRTQRRFSKSGTSCLPNQYCCSFWGALARERDGQLPKDAPTGPPLRIALAAGLNAQRRFLAIIGLKRGLFSASVLLAIQCILIRWCLLHNAL